MRTLPPVLRFLGLLAAFALCEGSTRVVPDDYPLIQTAIDSSAAGDTVLVNPGTYVENLIIERDLVLLATGAPEETIIDGNRAGSVIEVTADAYIQGLMIQNGTLMLAREAWEVKRMRFPEICFSQTQPTGAEELYAPGGA